MRINIFLFEDNYLFLLVDNGGEALKATGNEIASHTLGCTPYYQWATESHTR